MAEGTPDRSAQRIVWAALGIAISALMLLIGTWATNVNRRIDRLEDRQQQILIQLRALNHEHRRNFPPAE